MHKCDLLKACRTAIPSQLASRRRECRDQNGVRSLAASRKRSLCVPQTERGRVGKGFPVALGSIQIRLEKSCGPPFLPRLASFEQKLNTFDPIQELLGFVRL